jgi:hypothetical protein
MFELPKRGISRIGLDDAFEAEEVRKSNLLLEAKLLRDYQKVDEAAVKLAQAAEIEVRLGHICEEKGLLEKAWVHRYSAVCCWAQAGNFHSAIVRGDELLARPDLPERLRQHVQNFTDTIRRRRAQGAEGLAAANAEER